MKQQRIAPDLKEQIINRIKNDGVSVSQAATDHGIAENTIYSWLAKKVTGQPTLAENIKLKRENEQLCKLVGEITLKLSETQKRSDAVERYAQSSSVQRVWYVTSQPLLSTQETTQRLADKVSD